VQVSKLPGGSSDMPIYAETKARDMARSVLPSTKRRGARQDLELIRRRARRTTRIQLRQAVRAGADWDELVLDTGYWPTHQIRDVVRDRRAADNVSALVRWAPRAASHLRVEDRYSWVQARMPDSTVGWHAMTHVRWASGMMPAFEHENTGWLSNRLERQQRNQQHRFERYCLVHKALVHIIESGQLRQFNCEHKLPYQDPSGRWHTARTLRGLHDIDDFIASVYGRNGWSLHRRGQDPILDWLRR